MRNELPVLGVWGRQKCLGAETEHGEWIQQITFSMFWLIAHSFAIEPMLLVIVTRVALAKSSLLTLVRRSLLFICPKLENKTNIYAG